MKITQVDSSLAEYIVPDDFDQYGIQVGRPCINPKYLQIELTDRCNLRCANCVRGQHHSAGALFPLDRFEQLLVQLPDVVHVSFVGAGEALLVEKFASYVWACSQRGVYTSCNTNGLLVESKLRDLLDAGLNRLAVSVDGADDYMLAALRPGLTRAALQKAIQAAVQMTSGRTTTLSAAVTLGKANINSFPQITEFIAESGIQELTVESIHHWGADTSLNDRSLFHLEPSRVIESIEAGLRVAHHYRLKVRSFDYRRVLLERKFLRSAICPWPWDSIYVTAQGDVTPCCVNLEAEQHNYLGNIHREPISQIWSNQRYGDLRKSFLSGGYWPACSECVYRMEFGKIGGEAGV